MMGLKLAKAMKCDEVVAFTTSESKKDAALASGATKVCVTSSEDSKKVVGTSRRWALRILVQSSYAGVLFLVTGVYVHVRPHFEHGFCSP